MELLRPASLHGHHSKLRPREGRWPALGLPATVDRALDPGSSLFRKDPESLADARAWESRADQLNAGKLVERGLDWAGSWGEVRKASGGPNSKVGRGIELGPGRWWWQELLGPCAARDVAVEA